MEGLRKLINSVCNEVIIRAKKRRSITALDIRIRRLRGCHGQFLLNTLTNRIKRSDILIMDIGNDAGDGLNHNVLIELGMAIGLSKFDSKGLFVLKPVHLPLPSDLNGLLTTEYKLDKRTIVPIDLVGFRAALRAVLFEIGQKRDMIGPSQTPEIEIEDEEADV